jgi:hypothetical protein
VELGIAECERALVLDRNLAYAHGGIGMAKYFIGRGVETEAHVREALRLSPRDIYTYVWMCFAGIAKLWLGADAEAVAWLRRSVEANRNFPLATSISPLHWRTSVSWVRHALQQVRALSFIRVSRLAAIAPARLATILRTSQDASAPIRACGWPGCQRGDARPR